MIWCSAEGRAPTYYSYTSQIICRGAKPPSEVLFGSKFAAVLGAKIVKIIFFLLKFFTPFLQQFSEQELKKKFIFLKFFTPFLQQFWEQKLKKINTFPSFEVIHSICAAVLVAKIERKNNFFLLLKFFTPFLQHFWKQKWKKIIFLFLKFFTPFLQQFWEQKLKKK